ncbi:MAG TPA: PQQ-binding-like beta-propeller repeat protein, partial [Candidatus Thermoplasmatota archaeon]|nr:PQQ-binding-like beta-propeller repeat protein [Candidatus Thermoplasmatota archaeon]
MARGPLAPAFAALALAVLLLPVSVATPQDWTRPRLDDANSASDGAPPGGGGQLAWNRTVGVNVTSAPIAAMGKVIVGTAEGAVYALDVATGSILWSRTTATPITGTAAAFDGIAYVGTERGLVALSLDDGREVWSRHEDQPVVGAPLVANGIVYFGTTGGRFLALDVSNSDPVWGPVATDGPIHSGPVLAAGRVFVHTQAGTLWGFDALRGTVHVRADVSPGRATPAFSEGVLWLTAASGVRAIDPATGQVVREWGLPTQDRALTSPVVRDRRLWMGTDAGVAHFDLCDAREPAWTRSLPDVAADLALAGRFLYVMDAEGSVHAIEADTGRTAWTYAAGAPSSPQRPLPPIVTDGLLIFTTGAGDVRALDLRDASRLSFPPQRSDACAETRCELPSQP